MKKLMCVLLCVGMLLAGCGGRQANPVQVYVPGDERRACDSLQTEMAQIEQEIATKKRKQNNTTATNVVLGITGFFVLVPWFFMDLKDAEGTEIEALQQRNKRLSSLAVEKGCDFFAVAAEQ